MSLLYCSLAFYFLDWVVLSVNASQIEFVFPIGEGQLEKKRWFFQLLQLSCIQILEGLLDP